MAGSVMFEEDTEWRQRAQAAMLSSVRPSLSSHDPWMHWKDGEVPAANGERAEAPVGSSELGGAEAETRVTITTTTTAEGEGQNRELDHPEESGGQLSTTGEVAFMQCNPCDNAQGAGASTSTKEKIVWEDGVLWTCAECKKRDKWSKNAKTHEIPCDGCGLEWAHKKCVGPVSHVKVNSAEFAAFKYACPDCKKYMRVHSLSDPEQIPEHVESRNAASASSQTSTALVLTPLQTCGLISRIMDQEGMLICPGSHIGGKNMAEHALTSYPQLCCAGAKQGETGRGKTKQCTSHVMCPACFGSNVHIYGAIPSRDGVVDPKLHGKCALCIREAMEDGADPEELEDCNWGLRDRQSCPLLTNLLGLCTMAYDAPQEEAHARRVEARAAAGVDETRELARARAEKRRQVGSSDPAAEEAARVANAAEDARRAAEIERTRQETEMQREAAAATQEREVAALEKAEHQRKERERIAAEKRDFPEAERPAARQEERAHAWLDRNPLQPQSSQPQHLQPRGGVELQETNADGSEGEVDAPSFDYDGSGLFTRLGEAKDFTLKKRCTAKGIDWRAMGTANRSAWIEALVAHEQGVAASADGGGGGAGGSGARGGDSSGEGAASAYKTRQQSRGDVGDVVAKTGRKRRQRPETRDDSEQEDQRAEDAEQGEAEQPNARRKPTARKKPPSGEAKEATKQLRTYGLKWNDKPGVVAYIKDLATELQNCEERCDKAEETLFKARGLNSTYKGHGGVPGTRELLIQNTKVLMERLDDDQRECALCDPRYSDDNKLEARKMEIIGMIQEEREAERDDDDGGGGESGKEGGEQEHDNDDDDDDDSDDDE